MKNLNPLAGASVALALSLSASVLAASDDCATPTPISGPGVFAFDLTGATASQAGNVAQCLPNFDFMGKDVWFCWTADCTGIVTISTCGLTTGDTVLAIYDVGSSGCGCPNGQLPRCCNDDACEKQSSITCEVECGKQYMIQVGTRPGSPAFAGSIQIDCAGKPCDGGGHDPIACDCTGERPPLVDNLTTPFDPGLVAAVTNTRPNANDPAVVLVDLGNQGAATPGTNWGTDLYSHPTWTMSKLGSVLGVALDDVGNIFVGHTSSYPDFFGTGDTVGMSGPGAIYRLDGATGAVTTVIALPQQVDTNMPAAEPYPGLGQLSFDGPTQRLFAANFEDGRVYSIDPYDGTGFKVKSTYRHGGTITGTLPDTGLAIPNEPRGFEPLGKRIFAVKATQGRLYYSLWSEDAARQSTVVANEIWSVAFDANGVFQTGTARLEFAVPSLPGQLYSNPVADISFDNNCCMLLAERSFGNPTYGGFTPFPDTTTTAHDARTMRWCQGADGNWSQDLQFQVGSFSGVDSAGGIGYEAIADKVWMLADALSFPPNPWIYGLQGMPATGAPASGSIWVDIDNNFVTYQKWQQGSLDVNCLAESGCEFETIDIDCKPQADGTFDFLWTVSITNNSGNTADILILPDPAFAPNNVVLLNPPLAPGDKVVIDIPITGGDPGEKFCFTATLGSIKGDDCCTEEICIVLPDCDCFEHDEVIADLPGNGSFTVSLTMTNLEAFTAEWVTLAVSPAGAGTVTPSLVNIPSTPSLGSVTVGPVTVTTTAAPGSTVTLVVGMHAQSFHPCCFVEIPIVVPANAGSKTPGDIDGDGVVNGNDLAMLFNNWGGAGATDLNGDGVTNGNDLSILLANWG
jgi:hypothetical protein